MIFWEHPISFRRSLYYNIASRSDPMTGTIQPPLLAWAWRIAVGDPAVEPAIARHHEWLVANRDLDGDGLLWIVQPDESGLDSSPKYDPVWGWRAHARLGFPFLVARNRRLGWDARRVRDAGGPVLCEVMTNVLWGLARLATGEPSITPALVDRLWDERLGLFLDEAQPGGLRPEVETWAALAPLALPDLPEAIGRRLVEEHLLDPRRFWLAVPPPSVVGRRAQLRAGGGAGLEAPLLARADLDQRRLDAVDRLAPAGLPRRGPPDGPPAGRDRAPPGPARVLQPPHRRGPRRHRLRLDQPDPRDGRPGPGRGTQLPRYDNAPRQAATCSGR